MPKGGAASRLDGEYREAAWALFGSQEFDVVVIGGGVTGAGAALDAATRGLVGGAGRGARPRRRHVQPLVQALPRRAALSRAARVRAGARGAARARADDHPHRAASGQTGAVHLPADPSRLGTALCRFGPRALRHDGRAQQRAGAEAPHPGGGAAAVPRNAPRLADRGGLLLRRPGRRCPAHADRRAHGGPLRRGDPPVHPGGGVRARIRSGRRGAGPRRRGRARDDDPGRGRAQLHRRLDRSDPGAVGRPRSVQGARVQRRAHRRVAREDHRRCRADPAHRLVRAAGDPVEEPLADRHHRHRLEPRPRAPGRDPARHRLPARARQPRARVAADPRRHRGRVRGAAAAAGRRVRRHVGAVARARGGPGGARPHLDRRRQIHHLPGDGRRCDGRRR